MTLDKLRIYYNAVIGAMGGLMGWALITLLLRFDTNTTAMLFAKDALLGALVGLAIGGSSFSRQGVVSGPEHWGGHSLAHYWGADKGGSQGSRPKASMVHGAVHWVG